MSFLEECLISEVADRPRLEYVVIDCRGVNSIDVTTVKDLEDLVSGYQSRGIELLFAHMKRQVRERLQKAGWDEKYEGVARHPTTRDALETLGLLEKPRTAQTTEGG